MSLYVMWRKGFAITGNLVIEDKYRFRYSHVINQGEICQDKFKNFQNVVQTTKPAVIWSQNAHPKFEIFPNLGILLE